MKKQIDDEEKVAPLDIKPDVVQITGERVKDVCT